MKTDRSVATREEKEWEGGSSHEIVTCDFSSSTHMIGIRSVSMSSISK